MFAPLPKRGGKRPGSGRRPKGDRAGTPHRTRPTISGSNAMHVTIRVLSDVPALRKHALYTVLRRASANTAEKQRQFRIVHISIQNTHAHLVVESDDKGALARGMQSFQISAARQINKLLGRRGKIFVDRYHVMVIRNPTQMRAVLAYVLGNWKRHGVDRKAPNEWMIDWCASGHAFDGWAETWLTLWPPHEVHEWLVVQPAKSWLAREGWRRGGGLISVYDRPGPRPS